MARRLISAVALLALAVVIHAQAFGRFGYTQTPRQGGIIVDRSGFVADFASADRFNFAKPSKIWQALQTTALGQVILLSEEGRQLPEKIRMNLLAPGPEIYFASGIRFDIASTGAPYLSWAEGSVGADIPTPDTSWVLVSFKNPQPPVLLCFLGGPASVTLTGKPGDWHLVSDKPYAGWVRAVLPFGSEPIAAGGASALGQQTQRLTKSLAAWQRDAPHLTGFSAKGDADGVSAYWTFDGPGALVPSAALLAPQGGYKLQVASKLVSLDGETADGPRAAVAGNSLAIRFPVKRVPNGRPLAIGAVHIDPPGTVSPIDIPSVVDLGLECLIAAREPGMKQLADDTLAQYISDADYVREPNTAQELPFAADGRGLDLAAAQALLMQSISLSTKPTSDDNSLLTSLAWRRDWATWRFDGANERIAWRASSIGAVAGALCPEPSRRLDAAMAEAGLAALRAKTRAAKDRIEPLASLRALIFGDIALINDPFGPELFSHTRVFGDLAVRAEKGPKGVLLTWKAEDTQPHVITVISSYPLTFDVGNLADLDVSAALGTYSLKVTAKAPGRAEMQLILPDWAPPLPAAAWPSPYSEAVGLH